MANIVEYCGTEGVGELLQISALWERVSISTNPENLREIGEQTLEKTPFKHAPRKFGLSFFTQCDFLLNVAFLRGPYPETVHHVGGFMQVSHKQCCYVGILKKMMRVAFQIVESKMADRTFFAHAHYIAINF